MVSEIFLVVYWLRLGEDVGFLLESFRNWKGDLLTPTFRKGRRLQMSNELWGSDPPGGGVKLEAGSGL